MFSFSFDWYPKLTETQQLTSIFLYNTIKKNWGNLADIKWGERMDNDQCFYALIYVQIMSNLIDKSSLSKNQLQNFKLHFIMHNNKACIFHNFLNVDYSENITKSGVQF